MAVVTINATPIFYGNLLNVILSAIILAFAARIPMKRRYHWTFMLYVASFAWSAAIGIFSQAQLTVQGYYSLILWGNFAGAGSYLTFSLLSLFVFQFTSKTTRMWQKLTLSAFFGYTAFASVLLVVDEPLILLSARATPLGYVAGLGSYALFERPFGIWVPGVIMSIVPLLVIIRSYQTTKSPLLRGQLMYLAGVLIIVVANQLGSISMWPYQFLPAGTKQVATALEAGILLVGITRHGFYGVAPTKETAGPTPHTFSLEDGRSFLARDQKSAFEAFSELVRNGRSGLCVTRVPPDEVRKTYGLETTPIRWLTEEKGSDAIPPTDLLGLSLSLKDFASKAERPVVIIQGIEYLTTINGFSPILRLVHGLNDLNAKKKGILLMSVLPKSLGDKEDALLSSETSPLPQPSVKGAM